MSSALTRNDETFYIGDGGDEETISAQAMQPRNPGHTLGSLGVCAAHHGPSHVKVIARRGIYIL